MMEINIEKLRKDLVNDSYGSFFVGGFGGAMIEAQDIERMKPDKLVSLAIERGFDLSKYQF